MRANASCGWKQRKMLYTMKKHLLQSLFRSAVIQDAKTAFWCHEQQMRSLCSSKLRRPTKSIGACRYKLQLTRVRLSTVSCTYRVSSTDLSFCCRGAPTPLAPVDMTEHRQSNCQTLWRSLVPLLQLPLLSLLLVIQICMVSRCRK